MNMDFTFEESPWELFSRRVQKGERVSALRLLTVLEGEDDTLVEEAFDTLSEKQALLDLADLPKREAAGELGSRLAWEEKLTRQGKLLTDLEENDPLRLYLEELAATPACGDSQVLALELLEERSERRVEDIQQQLTTLGLSRVVQLAKNRAGNRVLLIDLIQEGSMGLWQAILSYNGGDFDAYADGCICFAMDRAIVMQARQDGVGQKMRSLCDDYRAADRALLASLGRNPSLEEIAAELHISPEEAYRVESLVQSASLLAKAKQPAEAGQQTEEDDQAVENTAYYQSRARVAEMLEGLDETQAKLICLRFGLEGGLPLSAQEVGKKMNMTAEEVLAMEQAALAQIRKKV